MGYFQWEATYYERCCWARKNAKHLLFSVFCLNPATAPIGINSVSARKHLYVYSFQSIYSIQLQNQISTAVFAFYLIFHSSWQKIKEVKWFARGHIMSQNLESRLNPGYSLAPAHGTCLLSKPHKFQLLSLLTWTEYEEVCRESVLSRNSAGSRLSVVKCWV